MHEILYKSVGCEYQGVNISYAKEEEKLGTGGAIKNAMKHVSSDPFFVLNGDVLIQNFDLDQMINKQEKIERDIGRALDGLLMSTFVDDVSDYGEIVSDDSGKIVNFKEKQRELRSGYINGGIYLFRNSISNYFPDENTFSIERDIFPTVSYLYSLQTRVDLIDVGVPERLAYAREKFSTYDQ